MLLNLSYFPIRMLSHVRVGGPQKDSVSPLTLCSVVKSLGFLFFGGNEWLQLSFCAWGRGRSLWSVNERPVESVGGQENG